MNHRIYVVIILACLVGCENYRINHENTNEVTYVIGNTLRDGGSTWLEYVDRTGKRRGIYMDGFIKEMGRSNKVFYGKYISGYKDQDCHEANAEEIGIIVKALMEYKSKYYPEYRIDSLIKLQRQYRKDMKNTECEFDELDELTIYSAITAFIEHAQDSCPTSK